MDNLIDLYNKEIERISKNTDIENYLSLLHEEEISATRIQMLFHYSFPRAKEFLENLAELGVLEKNVKNKYKVVDKDKFIEFGKEHFSNDNKRTYDNFFIKVED